MGLSSLNETSYYKEITGKSEKIVELKKLRDTVEQIGVGLLTRPDDSAQ